LFNELFVESNFELLSS